MASSLNVVVVFRRLCRCIISTTLWAVDVVQSVKHGQCDHIGILLKSLGDILSYKITQLLGNFLCFIRKKLVCLNFGHLW